jgi:hypothetical protein
MNIIHIFSFVGQKRFINQDNGHQDESIEIKSRFIVNKSYCIRQLVTDG